MVRRYKSGVPKSFRHVWKYKGVWDEVKVAPKRWKFRFRATKSKGAKSYGSFGKGTIGSWRIKGIQRVRKTGLGTYQIDFRGYKTSRGFKVTTPKGFGTSRRPRKRKY